MATQKRVTARIIPKHDIEENWNKAVNFIPLKGEMIIYDADETHTNQRVKYGDGVTVVSQLPFHTKVADWNQHNENENDYVANRPVYEDIIEADYTRLPYFPNSRYRLIRDPYGSGYTQIANKLSLVEGQEYEVTTMGSSDGIEWNEWVHTTLTASVTVEGETTADGLYTLPAGVIKLVDEQDYYPEIYVGVKFNNLGDIVKSSNTCIYFTSSLSFTSEAVEYIIHGIPSTDYITKRLPADLVNGDINFNQDSYNPQSGIAVKEAIVKYQPSTSSTVGDGHIKTVWDDNTGTTLYTEGIGHNEELKTVNKDTIVDAVNELNKRLKQTSMDKIANDDIVTIHNHSLTSSYPYGPEIIQLSSEEIGDGPIEVLYTKQTEFIVNNGTDDKHLLTICAPVYNGTLTLTLLTYGDTQVRAEVRRPNSDGKWENTHEVLYLPAQFLEHFNKCNKFQLFVLQNVESKKYYINLVMWNTDNPQTYNYQWDILNNTYRKTSLYSTNFVYVPTLDSNRQFYSEMRKPILLYNTPIKHSPLTLGEDGFIELESVEVVDSEFTYNTNSWVNYNNASLLTQLSTQGKMYSVVHNGDYGTLVSDNTPILENCCYSLTSYHDYLVVISFNSNSYYLNLIDTATNNIVYRIPMRGITISPANTLFFIWEERLYILSYDKSYVANFNYSTLNFKCTDIPISIYRNSCIKVPNVWYNIRIMYPQYKPLYLSTKKRFKFEAVKSINEINTTDTVYGSDGHLTIDNISATEHKLDVSLDLSGKNLFDISQISVSDSTSHNHISEVGENYIIVTTSEDATGNCYYQLPNTTLRKLCPALQVGKTYTLNADTESTVNGMYLNGITTLWQYGKSLTVTEETLNSGVSVYGFNANGGQANGNCRISNIMVTEGTQTYDYTSYSDLSNVSIQVSSKNIFDIQWERGVILLDTGVDGVVGGSGYRTIGYIPITPGVKYTFSGGTRLYPLFYDQDYNFIKHTGPYTNTFTFTAEEGQHYLRILDYQIYIVPTNSQLEVGSKATEYQPYTNTTFVSDLYGKFDIPYMAPSMIIDLQSDTYNIKATYLKKLNNIYDDIINIQKQINDIKGTPIADEELLEDSTNPVQNKVLFAYIKSLEDRLLKLEGNDVIE